VRAWLVILPIAASALACNQTGPGDVPLPHAPATPFVMRLELSGPASVPPGETRKFTATAIMTDGSTPDVTAAAEWESRSPTVLSVARGVATGLARGEADIVARYGERTGFARQILVLPDGTYRISGRVLEAGYGLADAKVEVAAGPGAGLATITESCLGCGGYSLYGVSGDSTIRITKDGYETWTATVNVTHHERLDFTLIPATAPPDPSGAYRLTIAAADECRDALSPELRERVYHAVVTRDGKRLTVKLDAPTIDTDALGYGSRFFGALEVHRAIFFLNEVGYSPSDISFVYAAITERVAPAPARLAISGSVTATPSPSGITGTLDGVIQTMHIVREAVVPLASCRSANHRFVFQR
jgi:hypothetical protein